MVKKKDTKVPLCCCLLLLFNVSSEVMMVGTISLQVSVFLCLLIKHENQVLSWGKKLIVTLALDIKKPFTFH